MNNWERLMFRRARLQVFFWAARQAVLLFVLVTFAVAMAVEAVLNGPTSMPDQLFTLIGR
jgi:hypothetical protein